MSIWSKYEKCRSYTEDIGLIDRTNEQWDFYLDNQWNVGQNAQLSTGTALPFFNIIKSSVKFQTSTIAQNAMVPTFNEMSGDEFKADMVGLLNKLREKEWRLGKQKQKSWKIIKNGLIEGSQFQYCGTQDPKDDQIISVTNIFFGDEANPNIQEQPYVMIRERLLVSEVQRIAKESGISAEKIKTIQPDTDDDFLIGEQNVQKDIEGKCTSILYFEKKDGVVWFGRSINGLEYQPVRPMESKVNGEVVAQCKLYPIASYSVEEIPNSARGKSAVRGMIPNQISINKILARRDEATKQYAFPKGVYDATRIRNAEDLGRAGTWIAVDSGTDNVKGLIDYINPMSQSPDAAALQNDLIQTTRELNGSIDALTGATDPTRVSGAAVIAMRDQSALPLNENVDAYKQFVEDLARIWFEQKKVYNPEGIEVDGFLIPMEVLQGLEIEVSIDISQETPWTKNAEQAFLDNLLAQNRITLEQYVELSPDNSVVPKGKMRKMFAQMAEQPIPQGGMNETPM